LYVMPFHGESMMGVGVRNRLSGGRGRDGQVEPGGERDVADRREGAVPEAAVLVAVGEGSTARADDAAARSGQNMVTGRRIPFHGGAAAHIDIGLARGDEAEFQGRG